MVAVIIMALAVEAVASSGGAPLWNKTAKPEAQKPKTTAPSGKPSTGAAGSTAAGADDLARQRAFINAKRNQIDNTTWEVELIPISGKGKNKKDVIIFSDKKVSMEGLAKEGFASTNFSLSTRSNKKLVWETMQKKDDDIVYFKGELTPELDSMTGVVSFQRIKTGTQDFTFRSMTKKEAVSE